MNAAQLAREVKQAGLDVPVVVLAYDYREIKNFSAGIQSLRSNAFFCGRAMPAS